MARTNPLQFIQQVRTEIGKVVWPSRREVMMTSAMVLVMTFITGIFFFFVDWLIRTGSDGVLTYFGG